MGGVWEGGTQPQIGNDRLAQQEHEDFLEHTFWRSTLFGERGQDDDLRKAGGRGGGKHGSRLEGRRTLGGVAFEEALDDVLCGVGDVAPVLVVEMEVRSGNVGLHLGRDGLPRDL